MRRLINSDEIQSKVRAPKEGTAPAIRKANPFKSATAMATLNPAAATLKKRNAEAQAANTAKKSKKAPSKEVSALKKKYYRSMVASE